MIQVNPRSTADVPFKAGQSTAGTQGSTVRPLRTSAATATTDRSLLAKGGGIFPDPPLISSQPLRYNVQLNQQLTAVQQADRFLLGTEKQLLQLNHLIARRAPASEIASQAGLLLQQLAKRESLAMGTVDRQLHLTLQAKPRVSFTLPDGAQLVNNSQPEVITFSLAGQQRNISAAMLEGNSPQQNLLRLNQALGKWGVHGRLSAQQLSFQVEEQRWPQVSQHLSVQGGRENVAQGQFYPLKPQLESGLEELLQQLERTPGMVGSLPGSLEQSLETLTQQRRTLQQTRERVQQRIDSMATFEGAAAALRAAEELRDHLHSGGFAVLSQALSGQANLQTARVRNVLAQD